MRESSTSITHLVEIVAEEVFNTMFDDKMEELKEKEKTDFSTDRSGEVWSIFEQETLRSEYDSFVTQMAARHKRTRHAIIARLERMI